MEKNEDSIYLDFNATTPIDLEVQKEMLPHLTTIFGNPSSAHTLGKGARAAMRTARQRIADLINSSSEEIIFTSGGTESNNMAIKGVAFKHEERGKHIITSNIEHPAVTEVCEYLEKKGFKITYLPVDETGRVRVSDVKNAITPETILITIMHSNNETGTLQPISEIGELARKHDILFHTDASQSLGKVKVDVQELKVDLLTIAGHKLYAPKGVGALYVRKGVLLEKFMHGASQETNQRAGTENLMQIVGLGAASFIAKRDFEKNTENMKKTRNLLHQKITERIKNVKFNGNSEFNLPNTLSISFHNAKANEIVLKLSPVVCVSAGAACHSEGVSISHVLAAMGVSEDWALGTIRFSTGKNTTEEEVLKAVDIICKVVPPLMS